jgi:hypothetical protein
MDDLHSAALEYGIILKDLGVLDGSSRVSYSEILSDSFFDELTGEIASTMDKLTKRAFQGEVGGGCHLRRPHQGPIPQRKCPPFPL